MQDSPGPKRANKHNGSDWEVPSRKIVDSRTLM